MSTLTQGNTLSDLVLREEPDFKYSRDAVTLITGQNLALGTVLGKITLASATETHASNTGNGAMTLDVTTPVLANAQLGVYTAKCITAASNGGTFRVFDPLGREIGEVAVAATFADQVKFVIADGSTDFIVGDTFLITVAAGSGKVTKLAPAALDGSQYAYGVLGEAVDATSADVASFAIVRDAILKTATLVWPTITTAQKNAAIAALNAAGVILRTAY